MGLIKPSQNNETIQPTYIFVNSVGLDGIWFNTSIKHTEISGTKGKGIQIANNARLQYMMFFNDAFLEYVNSLKKSFDNLLLMPFFKGTLNLNDNTKDYPVFVDSYGYHTMSTSVKSNMDKTINGNHYSYYRNFCVHNLSGITAYLEIVSVSLIPIRRL